MIDIESQGAMDDEPQFVIWDDRACAVEFGYIQHHSLCSRGGIGDLKGMYEPEFMVRETVGKHIGSVRMGKM